MWISWGWLSFRDAAEIFTNFPVSFKVSIFCAPQYPIPERKPPINWNTVSSIVTNLEPESFPPDELKKLYALRWGVETSFRELKYRVGLIHFHSKKEEHILQEIFARFIMYNFASLITRSVIIERKNRKFTYKANFSVAIHVCRAFFLGNVSPSDLEAIIARYVSPIRPGRTNPRRASRKMTISFNYRLS